MLFIFDMDNVLYEYNWRVRMAAMTEHTGLDLARLRELWWNDDGEWAAEAGRFATADDYLRALRRALGVHVDEDAWVKARGGAMTPWADSISAVGRAAELGTVTLLTNNGALTAKHLPTLAPELVPLFGEHLFTSSDYGARKPDPIVFERVLERYETDAADAFFADDLAENIAGARSVGITAHLFSSPAGLLAAIEAFAAARV
ncbi:MAG: hydrolase [Leifsonia sp.]|jgi:putative hydrolase of the HAD superfamily|nr:hydrolase [Leifsonia sp.]MDQ1588352.1 glucose-phosphatase [Microbacteriaceae bacterium]